MALATSVGALLAAAAFCFLAAAVGQFLLRLCRLAPRGSAEHFLSSTGLGVILFEVVVFFFAVANLVRIGVLVVFALMAVVAIFEFISLWQRVSTVLRELRGGTSFAKLLLAAILLVLLFQGIAAMAPLTGSDALHYHFAAPELLLRNGWHPDFFLLHSFLIGQ